MERAVAHLPDPGIGLPPDVTDVIGDASEDARRCRHRARARLRCRATRSRAARRRCRAAPVRARRCRRGPGAIRGSRRAPMLALVGADAAVEAIQDVELGLGQRRRLHEPPEQRPRLGVASEPHQRADHEVGVANPAEAIVPVALAADLLGQRRRRRGDRGAGRREDHQLQRQRAPQDEVGPWAVVGARVGPLLPEADRVVEPGGDRLRPGHDQRFGVGAWPARAARAAGRDLEPPFHARRRATPASRRPSARSRSLRRPTSRPERPGATRIAARARRSRTAAERASASAPCRRRLRSTAPARASAPDDGWEASSRRRRARRRGRW